MAGILPVLLALQAVAGDGATSAPTAPTSTVTVTAPRPARSLPQRVRQFVYQVGQPTGSDQLPRWPAGSPVCVHTLGFQPDGDKALRTNVEQLARDLGIPVQTAPCNTNVLIIASSDPPKTAAEVQKIIGPMWGRDGPSAMRHNLETPAPVHWWRGVRTSQATGGDGGPYALASGNPVKGTDPVPTYNGYGASRITQQTRENMDSALVVVDSRQIGGVTMAPFAAYVAMGLFAPVSSGAQKLAEAPSILGLFTPGGGVNPDAPQGITEWDMAYLKGLYAADPSLNTNLQNGQIQVSMTRQLSAPPAPQEPIKR